MEFIEAPAFTRHISDYLDAEQYRELQNALASNPELGDLMPGREAFENSDGGIRDEPKDAVVA